MYHHENSPVLKQYWLKPWKASARERQFPSIKNSNLKSIVYNLLKQIHFAYTFHKNGTMQSEKKVNWLMNLFCILTIFIVVLTSVCKQAEEQVLRFTFLLESKAFVLE